jgi:HEAT repeats
VYRSCKVLIVATAFVMIPVGATAQLDGSFSLSEAPYLAGEPVFLLFTVKNVGSQPVLVRTARPLSFCSGYQFDLNGARDREANGCGPAGAGGSCVSSGAILKPGETRTDRILLNARYDLRQPGVYPLHVTHRLDHAPADEGLAGLVLNRNYQDFQDQLEILIEPSKPDDLKPEFAEYARQLDSSDLQTKLEAEEVIAYLAPPFMEPSIIKMLDSADLRSYGVEGLHNLGTPSAHQALADVVKSSPPSPYQNPAISYLGGIGDKSDIATLLNTAHTNAEESSNRETALEAIGAAGGDDAVAVLVAELNDPDIDSRQAAIRGLYLTGSRLAVPVLIELLRSPQWRESGTAESGLEVLTHRRGASGELTEPPPSDTYFKWIRWWKTDGQTATIFSAGQCGEIEPLPSP